MLKELEYIVVAFLLGVMLGMLMGISIRYPADLALIQKYQTVCGTQPIKKAKIGITGDVYSVTCSNDIEVKVR